MLRAGVVAALLSACGGGCGAANPATDDGIRTIVDRAAGCAPSEDDCIDRPSDIPSIVLVGSFAHDRGCELMGIVVGTDYVTGENIARKGLAAMGWAEADGRRHDSECPDLVDHATTIEGLEIDRSYGSSIVSWDMLQ